MRRHTQHHQPQPKHGTERENAEHTGENPSGDRGLQLRRCHVGDSFRQFGQENLPSGGSSRALDMGAKFGTGSANDNAISAANIRAAREFRRLCLTVFGRGRLAEERACEVLGCGHRTWQRWCSGETRVPHAAVLRVRELLRECA